MGDFKRVFEYGYRDVKQGFLVINDQGLHMFRGIPQVREQIPEVRGKVPDVREEVPELRETIPDIRETIPDIRETIPEVRGTVPGILKAFAFAPVSFPRFLQNAGIFARENLASSFVSNNAYAAKKEKHGTCIHENGASFYFLPVNLFGLPTFPDARKTGSVHYIFTFFALLRCTVGRTIV